MSSTGPPSRSVRPSPSMRTSLSASVSSRGASKLTTGGRPKPPETAIVGSSSTGSSGSEEQPATARASARAASSARRRAGRRTMSGVHGRDEGVHPFVTAGEGVLAQDSALAGVVELEVDPVHGVVAPPLLGRGDKVTPQLGPGVLRRHGAGGLDL